MKTKFNCIACGCCCCFVDIVLNNLEQINNLLDTEIIFPYSHNKGKCEKLLENNRCAVYEHRPIICNVLVINEIIAKKTGLSIETILKQQKKSCKELQEMKRKKVSHRYA